jgi:hypothetical protein
MIKLNIIFFASVVSNDTVDREEPSAIVVCKISHF